MIFKKPQRVRDEQEFIKNLAQAAIKVLQQDVKGAAKLLPKIWDAYKGKEDTSPEAQAWRLVTSCVAHAATDVLREPRMRSELSAEELERAIEGFLGRIPDEGELRPIDITNLALSPDLGACMDGIGELASHVAPENPFSEDQIRSNFQSALAASVSVACQENPKLVQPLTDALRGAAGAGAQREIAWERHAAWIRTLFHKDPIFSPEDDEDTPLSKVYLRLRCHWNEEHTKERKDEREPLRYRTATVARIHDAAHEWLTTSDAQDAIRVVAGGPGSGKSSFARAFASEVTLEDTRRVVFVLLQDLQVSSDLRSSLDTHLKRWHGWKHPEYTQGFPASPLGWHGEDTKPLLLVFDGLDELTAKEDAARELTRKFLTDVGNLLNNLNTVGPGCRALVLGRTTAVEDACREADLSLPKVLHIAPIRPMVRDDLRLGKNPLDEEVGEDFSPIIDPKGLMGPDAREDYWARWRQIKGLPAVETPDAVTDERMKDLNVEPLLLHLLIISDYCGEKWEEAADNRNLVYRDILTKVFERNKKKKVEAYKGLESDDFFDLMEAFGLAALRGNGRTGTHEEFNLIRDRYAPEKSDVFASLEGASLKNVALQIHTREDVEGSGFEFVHKSFGQYLAARALLGAGDRLKDALIDPRQKGRPEQIARDWVQLIGPADLDEAVIRFLRDEARLRSHEDGKAVVQALVRLFDWGLEHGFPVHHDDDLLKPTFNTLVERQRCAETALLAVMTSLAAGTVNRHSEKGATGAGTTIQPEQLRGDKQAASRLVHRLVNNGPAVRASRLLLNNLNLSGADLRGANLRGADLIEADLRGAKLIEADLGGANLRGADLGGANLRGANLIEADLREAKLLGADLGGADLRGAKLGGAKLLGAKLLGADLIEADLRGANLRVADLIEANLIEADLRGANLIGADLRGAKLIEADLGGANLRGADLRGADLREANLRGANLRGAKLLGANLGGADLRGAKLLGADLGEANLRGAKLRGADLIEADLRGADLRGADLRGAKLRGANLGGADLIGADLRGANLKSADLRDCTIAATSLRSADFTDSLNLSQTQVNATFGVQSGIGGTLLPQGIEAPDHWHEAEKTETDTAGHLRTYEIAYRQWRDGQS